MRWTRIRVSAVGMVILLIALLPFINSCDSQPTAVPEEPVALVSVTPNVDTMLTGENIQFLVELNCQHGHVLDRPVTWESSDPTIALIDATGKLTAISRGTVTIIARSEGKEGMAVIRVEAPANAVSVEPALVTLDIAETVQLTAVVTDPNGSQMNRPVVWNSLNSSVVRVSNTGLATAVAPGMAAVRANSDGKTGEATITVRVPVAAVTVTPDAGTVSLGQTIQLNAVPRDAGGVALIDRPVVWTSGNPALATVDQNGLVSALGVGNVTISATSQGRAGHATITIRVPVATVQVAAPGKEPLAAGATAQFTVTLLDANGNTLTDREVTWSSSDPAIATVDENGLVTGVAHGSVTISATCEGRTGSAGIQVTGESTTLGNNLSWPVVFSEGIGVTGLAVSTDPGVRPTAEENITVDALPFWYNGNVANYGTYSTQQSANVWQAEWVDGSAAGVQQAEVAWGDNLTHHSFNTHSMIRVEVGLSAFTSPQLAGFVMTSLYGTGEAEMQGTDGTL
ncbi:MAG: Ig-like domain-containing protein, partial [Gemmatimonadales bacterium]